MTLQLADSILRRGRGRPRRDESPDPQQILNAALRAFATHGWDGANLRMIAEMAKVDAALIARRFDGKMGLWQAVVDNVSDALVKAQGLEQEAQTSIGDRWLRMIERFVRLSLDRPDLGRFFVDEIARPGVRRDYVVQRIWSVHRDRLIPLMVEARDAGLLPAGCDPDALIAILVGAVAMPLLMRSVALPDVETPEGRDAFLLNILALFRLGHPHIKGR